MIPEHITIMSSFDYYEVIFKLKDIYSATSVI